MTRGVDQYFGTMIQKPEVKSGGAICRRFWKVFHTTAEAARASP
jgi:hypothetical protein